MMTFREVKGHERSNAETMCYGYQTWSEETLVRVYDDDDLYGGQRSSEVKCGKRCTLVTKLGQKESLMQVYVGDDLHEGQRSPEVKCGKLCYGYQTWSRESLMQV